MPFESQYPVAPDSGKCGLQLAEGEYQVVCPYDKSHRALNTKMSAHLEKCRRNYVNWYSDKNNREPFKLPCTYNPSHKYYPPELYFHEKICRQTYLTSNQVYADFFQMKMKVPDIGPKKTGQFTQSELEEIYKLLRCKPTTSRVEGTVQWGNPSLLREEKLNMPYEEKPKRMLEINRRTGKPVTRDLEKEFIFSGKSKGEFRVEDMPEYWVSDARVAPFYYMANWFNLKYPLFNCPPGLSKSQRREWEVHNSIRVEHELPLVKINPGLGPLQETRFVA